MKNGRMKAVRCAMLYKAQRGKLILLSLSPSTERYTSNLTNLFDKINSVYKKSH